MPHQQAKKPTTVIFLHIPKTAGTTLDQIIFRHYRRREIYGTGLVAQEGVKTFQNMDEARRQKYRLIKGHLSFGFHQFVPGPWTYFTFFRHPIKRTLSHLYYIQRAPKHPLYHLIKEKKMDLKQCLEAGLDPMLHNGHTRLLSGVWAEARAGTCNVEDLEKAKANLKQVKVIGLTEQFDASLLMLGKAFGWNNLFYTKKNVTAGRPTIETLSPENLEAVQAANQLDMELYNFAETLFAKQIEQQGPAFANEVIRFQARNRYLRPAQDLYWEMRKISVRTFIRQQIAQIRQKYDQAN